MNDHRTVRLENLPRTIGRSTLVAVTALGEVACLLCRTVQALFIAPPRRRVLALQLYHIGFLSLPVVLLTGLSVGLVLAVQAYATLRYFNGETVTGAMVNYTMVTQLAPVFTGLMLAGRVGSAIVAEIGSMKVTEQIDALRVMGTDPVSYLVLPRFLACVCLLPVLTALGCFAGIKGAEILALHVWNIDAAAYWDKSQHFVHTWHILTGLLNAVVFGAIIALVACRKGLQTGGGSSGVGNACTEGVVAASSLILISDFVLTVIIQKIHAAIVG